MRDHNRTADVPSEFVPNEVRHLNIHRVRAQARRSDHGIISVVFVDRAVQLICAAARSHDNGCRLREARVRSYSFNSKLLDSLNSRPYADDSPAETVHLCNTVQIDIQGSDFHPVDTGAARATLYARGQTKKQADIAAAQRKVADLAGLSHIPDHAACGLNRCRNVLNLDHRFHTSNPQRRVDRHALTHVESEWPAPGLKSFFLHGHPVCANRQGGEGIQAVLGAHSLP